MKTGKVNYQLECNKDYISFNDVAPEIKGNFVPTVYLTGTVSKFQGGIPLRAFNHSSSYGRSVFHRELSTSLSPK
jgi:hypothetical protein